MSCMEKRHVNHRMGSMLHHRFPNDFNDLFMDETDREVSTLTDRAFRSLCVGDDAVYNDEFLYGFSPFSCHKPLVGEPPKKTHHKECKKSGQHKRDKNNAKPWKQQQQQNISEMSSFLKALSVAEESCELIRNGGTSDSNGESWDKSALRSIQRELSEFSSDYHTGLAERHYKNHLHHQPGDGSSNKTHKDVGLPSGKSTKIKNGKSMVKLKKLNIKNFFLHSEFSPFQTWTDSKRYPFAQEETVTTILSTDKTPKWYDLPFYKELTEAHRKETLLTEEAWTGQKEAVEPSSPTVNKPVPPPPPPKIMPKPSATSAERCSSNGGDGTAAPWRRNSSRGQQLTVPVIQPGIPQQESNAKAADESLLLVKKDVKSVEVKAVEEVSSVASTPFSICQLMTPLIPSRQPTETSEILQAVLSPSVLNLPGRPHSEAKSTPEVPVKRENYKSLASSILFNLKDNRKRVKSRYSPPKFKTLELPEGDDQSSQSDNVKQAGSEGSESGLSTPAISKDGQPVFTPILEPTEPSNIDLSQPDNDKPLSDDYLLSNLLHDKRDENPLSPFKHSKMNKSPLPKKQNYPSLNLYKKASPVDSDMKYLQVPLSTNTDPPTEAKDKRLRDYSPRAQPKNTGFSSSTSNVIKDYSPLVSPHVLDKDRLSSDGKIPPNVPEKTKWVAKDAGEKDIGVLPTSKEIETGGQTMSTMEVIRAAREAINIAKNKARSASHSDSITPDLRAKEPLGNDLQFSMSPTREAATENSSAKAQETCKVKRRAPLKPDHLSVPDDNVSKSLKADEEAVKISNEDANMDTEVLGEVDRNIVSPLLLVNGVSVTQSPPDQASLSSKSSYFSVESTLHRNTETESNVYHSLENLSGEAEEVEIGQSVSPKDSSRPEMEYNCLADHEKELEVIKQPIKSPLKDLKVQLKDSTDSENIFRDIEVPHKDNDATTVSPTNTLSPTLGIPALFKVKDNSFANKLKKVMPAWSPRGSLIGSERVGEAATQDKVNPELPMIKETYASDRTVTAAETLNAKEIISSQSPIPMLSPSNIRSEIPKKPQFGSFLTVPQEDDRSSRASASSEGVESLPTSQVEAIDEAAVAAGVLVESEGTKVLSERSGSTCSGNDSQSSLPKPPAILPKSEKAIQKAIKLTNRRMKKEEAQKLPQKSSQSSSKHKAERHKSDKSEQKGSSSAKSGNSSDKKHSGKPQDHQQHSKSPASDDVNAKLQPRQSCDESHHNRAEMSHKSLRRSNDSVENSGQTRHARPSVASERQGRSSDRQARQNPEQRHCSSDRVISNVPVYKAHVGERSTSDRPFNRSQSIDRYLGGNGQRRLSADVLVNEKLDPWTERIEKSSVDELQQRGRARNKGSRDNPLRRSHSIDAYSTEVRNPPSLSRQSSHSSHLSRQSSIEHAIVTQSFPMTQRKLLQDPDSGRCFFVDLPVQVKTKTFFDPETGSYVQLPIQPPEATFTQASTMEVLTPPLVVYHGFVPVSLSPLAQKTAIQAHHVDPEEFEQRHLDRKRQMQCMEGHPYLEPAYGQHDHVLGDFMGTEELDCPS
ncbi:uncharacterized protein FYW49_018774 [Xenentodon cancila]